MSEKKLKIIGPYTPEHPGPFCTRDGRPVRILTHIDGSALYPIVGIEEGRNEPYCWDVGGNFTPHYDGHNCDLMNAEEVPVAREFWVNEYPVGFSELHASPEVAAMARCGSERLIRTIHVREVLPGDAE